MLVAGARLRLGRGWENSELLLVELSIKLANCSIVLFRRFELFAIYRVLVCGILCYGYNERCFNIFVLCGYLKHSELLVSFDDLFPMFSIPQTWNESKKKHKYLDCRLLVPLVRSSLKLALMSLEDL